jgi:hypothetical protein
VSLFPLNTKVPSLRATVPKCGMQTPILVKKKHSKVFTKIKYMPVLFYNRFTKNNAIGVSLFLCFIRIL